VRWFWEKQVLGETGWVALCFRAAVKRRVLIGGFTGSEKVGIQPSAPKGAIDFEGLAVSLKRYPDTKRRFSANCLAAEVEF